MDSVSQYENIKVIELYEFENFISNITLINTIFKNNKIEILITEIK